MSYDDEDAFIASVEANPDLFIDTNKNTVLSEGEFGDLLYRSLRPEKKDGALEIITAIDDAESSALSMVPPGKIAQGIVAVAATLFHELVSVGPEIPNHVIFYPVLGNSSLMTLRRQEGGREEEHLLNEVDTKYFNTDRMLAARKSAIERSDQYREELVGACDGIIKASAEYASVHALLNPNKKGPSARPLTGREQQIEESLAENRVRDMFGVDASERVRDHPEAAARFKRELAAIGLAEIIDSESAGATTGRFAEGWLKIGPEVEHILEDMVNVGDESYLGLVKEFVFLLYSRIATGDYDGYSSAEQFLEDIAKDASIWFINNNRIRHDTNMDFSVQQALRPLLRLEGEHLAAKEMQFYRGAGKANNVVLGHGIARSSVDFHSVNREDNPSSGDRGESITIDESEMPLPGAMVMADFLGEDLRVIDDNDEKMSMSFSLKLDPGFLSEHSGPYIPGYELKGIDSEGDYYFKLDAKGDPYSTCDLEVDADCLSALTDQYRLIGLDGMANKLGGGVHTVGEVVSVLRDESVYADELPSGVNDTDLRSIRVGHGVERFASLVIDGKLNVQCTGAVSFLEDSLAVAFDSRQLQAVRGVRINGDGGSLSRHGHVQLRFINEGVQYILDSTPGDGVSVFGRTAGSVMNRNNAQLDLSIRDLSDKPDFEYRPYVPPEEKLIYPEESIMKKVDITVSVLSSYFKLQDREALIGAVAKLRESDPIRRAMSGMLRLESKEDVGVDEVNAIIDYIDAYLAAPSLRLAALKLPEYSPVILRSVRDNLRKIAIAKGREGLDEDLR